MSETTYDPLLKAARWLTIFFMAVTVIVGAAVTIIAPALLVASDLVVIEMVAEGYRADFELVLAIAVLLWLVAALMAVGFFFFRNLLRIIGSVGQGDPFAPVNADRLTRMGWLAVTAQVLAIPAGAIGAWIQVRMEEVRIDFDVSLTGILLAIILFILARVFRHGAAMRADLEGTV